MQIVTDFVVSVVVLVAWDVTRDILDQRRRRRAIRYVVDCRDLGFHFDGNGRWI
jgi:hypothetical protein